MHVIPPAPSRVFLVRGGLRLHVFTSLLDLGRHLGLAALRELAYAEHRGEPAVSWYAVDVVLPAALVVRNEAGDVLTWREVLRACRELAPRKARDRFHTWNGEGPVPRTGRRRNYRFKRSIRTTQELRMIAGVLPEEGEPAWRGVRRNLPTAWDDLFPHRDRSWKRHRRTRWK